MLPIKFIREKLNNLVPFGPLHPSTNSSTACYKMLIKTLSFLYIRPPGSFENGRDTLEKYFEIKHTKNTFLCLHTGSGLSCHKDCPICQCKQNRRRSIYIPPDNGKDNCGIEYLKTLTTTHCERKKCGYHGWFVFCS